MILKVEQHWVDGKPKTLLVHRKGSTRAFPPHHPLIPVDYQFIGIHQDRYVKRYINRYLDVHKYSYMHIVYIFHFFVALYLTYLYHCIYGCIGQPVLIGGTMGTCSYVLTGTSQVTGGGI